MHHRHYTVEEANAALDSVSELLEQLREAKDELTDEEAHVLLADSAPFNGGGRPGRKVGEAFLEVRRILAALNEVSVMVRDIDRGLVDFPSLREGREVYLCWQLGEDAVSHWHDVDAGYAGRRPLGGD